MGMIAYRPDIDGLRAVAVLLVVFYHLDLFFVKGGYIGVDVFFVISGYLITSIILPEIKSGSFSLLNFYERRVRRILPALFTVMAATVIGAYFIVFPQEFEYFGQSLAATVAFGSNILFWDQSGYFEVGADLVPLLHTWSLAVEEQFYLFFPLGLMFLYRFCRGWVLWVMLATFVVSLLIAVIGLEFAKYAAVFYLLPARGWELLAGAFLAFSVLPPVKKNLYANCLSFVGLGAILYAGFFYTSKTLFPGFSAILPVMGTVLVIYAGMAHQGYIGKFLSLRPVVFIGKISYSLYLWHWPLVVFYHYASPVPLDFVSGLAIFFLSFVLSCLSWRFMEQPARKARNISCKKIFTYAGLASLFFLGLGLFIYYAKGLPNRFSEDVQKLSRVSIGKKIPDIKQLGFEGNSGIIGDKSAEISFAVWGDSHTRAAVPALHHQAEKFGKRGYVLEDSGCVPLAQDIVFMEEACNKFNRQALEFLRKHSEIKKVILIARWGAYEIRFEKKRRLGVIETEDTFQYFLRGVFQEIEEMGKEIYFVTEAPPAPVKEVPLYLARAAYYGQEIDLKVSLEDYLEDQGNVSTALKNLENDHKFTIIHPYKKLCQKGECPMTLEGRSLYYDDDHLSTYGALYVQDVFAPIFKD